MTHHIRTIIRWTALVVAVALIGFLLMGRRAGLRLFANDGTAPHAGAQANAPGAKGSPEPQKRILYWYDPMHPAYHSDKAGIAPDCGMALVPMYESKTPAEQASADAGLIHMPKSQQRALGVRLTTVEEQSVSRTLRTSGVVTADETRIAHVHVKTAGWVEEVYANFVGQLVHKGQALLTVYSPDLVATQQEYLIARRGQQQLGKSQYEEVAKSSQSLLDSARERLRLWDMTEPADCGAGPQRRSEQDDHRVLARERLHHGPQGVSAHIDLGRYGVVHDCGPVAGVGDGRCV